MCIRDSHRVAFIIQIWYRSRNWIDIVKYAVGYYQYYLLTLFDIHFIGHDYVIAINFIDASTFVVNKLLIYLNTLLYIKTHNVYRYCNDVTPPLTMLVPDFLCFYEVIRGIIFQLISRFVMVITYFYSLILNAIFNFVFANTFEMRWGFSHLCHFGLQFSVSYTHLDVYKRQPQGPAQSFPLIFLVSQ